MKSFVLRRQLLKIADAMVAGSQQRKKCDGQLFDLVRKQVLKQGNWVTRFRLGGSCALGAVYEGVFGTPPIVVTDDGEDAKINGGEGDMYNRLRKKFPALDEMLPDGSGTFENEIIAHNDGQGWGRVRIANWLRRIAAKL